MRKTSAKAPDRREQDRIKTRTAILDAAEALMRENGHGAVTSRRVAERAGLKSQLVHYHFGTMDDLFLELFRRSEKRYFRQHLAAINSSDPLGRLWQTVQASQGMDIVAEFISAAHHRKVLKDELAGATSRFRMLYDSFLSNEMEPQNLDGIKINPTVLYFLLVSVGATLISDADIGVSEGHDEITAFMEALIEKVKGARPDSAPAS